MRSAAAALLPDQVRARLRLLQHNLTAVRDPRRSSLRLRRVDETWTVSDGIGELAIASPARWTRSRNGIDAGCRAIAAIYGIGTDVRIQPGDVVVDVGANVGEVARACARWGATVIAIEPDPATNQLLRRNCAGLDVHIHGVAATDTAAPTPFWSVSDTADSSLIPPLDSGCRITVEGMPLDHLTEGIDAIRVLKCDAEGAEPEVLRGAESTLARTSVVSLDCSPERRGESTAKECASILERSGFTVTERTIETRRMLLAFGRDVSAGTTTQD